jgi:hypothetical protein
MIDAKGKNNEQSSTLKEKTPSKKKEMLGKTEWEGSGGFRVDLPFFLLASCTSAGTGAGTGAGRRLALCWAALANGADPE